LESDAIILLIKRMLFNSGVWSCCWQLGSATLTTAFSVVVSNRTQPRGPMINLSYVIVALTINPIALW